MTNKKFDQSRLPPWYKRKSKELRAALMHPDMNEMIEILRLCDKDSVIECADVVIVELAKGYNLSYEVAYAIVLRIVSDDDVFLEPFFQVSGVEYFSLVEQAGGPSIDPKTKYEELMAQFEQKQFGTVYLKIGKSATKEDVLYFIEHNWDGHISPLRKDDKIHSDQQVRVKPSASRDALIYTMHINGLKNRVITDLLNQHLKDTIDESQVRQVIKRLKPKSDLLIDLNKQFNQLNKDTFGLGKTLFLKTSTTNGKTHLYIELL
jgi:Mor family transcriptional regulator